jgi:hypothetical protein
MIWKRDDIRSARRKHLKPILESLGYRLRPLQNGNYEVTGLAREIVIKENYWVCTDGQSAACPERSREGNSIDFCTKILNMSFNQAMKVIMLDTSYDMTGSNVRSHRDKSGGFIQK